MDDQAQALGALVGRWRTLGRTIEVEGAEPLEIDAVDTYEWLPGGALLHRVDARVGDEHVEGAEIIGWDPERGCYLTQYFGNDGPASYEATLGEEAGTRVWRMRSGTDRFRGEFSEDGDVLEGRWERLEGERWLPWMEVRLTREAGG
jgi:hypothetical protein